MINKIKKGIEKNGLALTLYISISIYHLLQRMPDVNWDRANYADYIVYAWINNRSELDWAPGGLNNFNNPLTSVPGYLFSVSNGILGYLSVLLILIIIYHFASRILDELFSRVSAYQNGFIRAFAINVMLGGPLFFSEIGTTMGDWTAIPFFVASLSYFIRCLNDRQPRKMVYLSVFFMSTMTFLKITNAIFLISLLLAIILTRNSWRELRSSFFPIILGFLSSALIFGFWMYNTFKLTGNPIFPYWNAIFKSPYYPSENFRDMRWSLDSISELMMPLIGFWGSSNLELVAFDPRVTVTLLLGLVFVLKRVFKPTGTKQNETFQNETQVADNIVKGLLIFQISAVALWSYLLFYARYAMPLEITLGVLLLILVNKLNFRKSTVLTALVGIFLLSFVSIIPNWNMYQSDLKQQQMQSSYIGDPRWQIINSELEEKNNTFVLVGMHLSYLVRSAHPSNSFVRIEFYGRNTNVPRVYEKKILGQRVFLLTNEDPNSPENIEKQASLLSRRNLQVNLEKCNGYSSVSENYWICPIVKISG
jgi:hypothetical protein